MYILHMRSRLLKILFPRAYCFHLFAPLHLNIWLFLLLNFQERNEDPSGSESSRTPEALSGTQTPKSTSGNQSSSYGLFTRRLSAINTSFLTRTQSLGSTVLQHVRPSNQQSWKRMHPSPPHDWKTPALYWFSSSKSGKPNILLAVEGSTR